MASVGPSMTSSPGLMPSRLTTGTMPPITIGNWARPISSSSLPGSGASLRAEGHGLGFDLLDAAAGTDRLIVQPVAGFLFVGVGPFGVDRIGERSASAGNVGGVGRNERGGGDETGGCQCGPVFHGISPCLRPKTRTARKRPVAPVFVPDRSGSRCCFKRRSPRRPRTFLFALRGGPKSRSAIGVACHRSIKLR